MTPDCDHYFLLAEGATCKFCGYVEGVSVECDASCNALLSPVTFDETRAALEHWKSHGEAKMTSLKESYFQVTEEESFQAPYYSEDETARIGDRVTTNEGLRANLQGILLGRQTSGQVETYVVYATSRKEVVVTDAITLVRPATPATESKAKAFRAGATF